MMMLLRLAVGILWVVALFYGYGAVVHVMNILGLSGFSWLDAPLQWQVLDIVYLVLDVVVAIGFIARWWLSYWAFYIAASTQILLYTVFRDWILHVPAEFPVSDEQEAYLDSLVLFHSVTLVIVSFSIVVIRKQARRENSGEAGSAF